MSIHNPGMPKDCECAPCIVRRELLTIINQQITTAFHTATCFARLNGRDPPQLQVILIVIGKYLRELEEEAKSDNTDESERIVERIALARSIIQKAHDELKERNVDV